mmetsp:Transcript_40148/g.99218  ORF Transcript_40148/g.99218 Transcript_40148/m.99218 type:complete len:251 (-) Transcript_40148:484-1236(-)
MYPSASTVVRVLLCLSTRLRGPDAEAGGSVTEAFSVAVDFARQGDAGSAGSCAPAAAAALGLGTAGFAGASSSSSSLSHTIRERLRAAPLGSAASFETVEAPLSLGSSFAAFFETSAAESVGRFSGLAAGVGFAAGGGLAFSEALEVALFSACFANIVATLPLGLISATLLAFSSFFSSSARLPSASAFVELAACAKNALDFPSDAAAPLPAGALGLAAAAAGLLAGAAGDGTEGGFALARRAPSPRSAP